jgi:phosphoglucosamine mutase
MSTIEFGTDGYRGEYNESDLIGINSATFEALTQEFTSLVTEKDDESPTIIVGYDTRTSGPILAGAVSRGAAEAGATVWNIGVAPTPAIAWLAKEYGFYAVSITASHNPNTDNGYKLFSRSGNKPGRDFLDELSARFNANENRQNSSKRPGVIYWKDNLTNIYLGRLIRSIGDYETLKGQTIIFDGAEGATHKLGPILYKALGADVVKFACNGNGARINRNCGAASLGGVRDFLEQYKADNPDIKLLGAIACDGDGDRVMALDSTGRTIDGNYWLQHLAEKQTGIVGTLYTNDALRQAVGKMGVEFHECANGDSYVTQKLIELTEARGTGFTRGGEFSGHLIDLEHIPSGDGLYMGAWLAAKAAQKGADFTDIRDGLELWPERMESIRLQPGVVAANILETASAQEAVSLAKTSLEDQQGRVIVRPSGTEPLIRVWGSAEDETLLSQVMDRLMGSIK